MKLLKKIWEEDRGQALSEYGLVLGVIAIAVIASLTLLKDKLVALFNKIANALSI